MNEVGHTRKALEEVYRLADEKIVTVNEYLKARDKDYKNYHKEWSSTNADIERYFNGLIKQLNKWKQVFVQLVGESYEKHESKFLSFKEELNGLCSKINIPHDRRKSAFSQSEANETIFMVHKALVKIEESRDSCDDFLTANSLPLRFIGKFNLETLQRDDIGTVEHLADSSSAEILPINVARIKLGGLFNVKFQLSHWPCPAAKKHVVHKVTREDHRTGDTVKVMSYLFDQKDGKYTLGFPITAIVPHTVSVEYMGHHIKNSPYTIVFKAGPTTDGDSNNNNASLLPNDVSKNVPCQPLSPETLSLTLPTHETMNTEPRTRIPGTRNHVTEPRIHISEPSNHVTEPRIHISEPSNHVTERRTHISDPRNHVKEPANHVQEPQIPVKRECLDEILQNGAAQWGEDFTSNVESSSQYSTPNQKPALRSKFSCFAEQNALFENQKILEEVNHQMKIQEPLEEANEFGTTNTFPSAPEIPRQRRKNEKVQGVPVKGNKIKATHKCVIESNFRFPIGCGAGPNNETFVCDTGHGVVHQYDGEFKMMNTFGHGMKLRRPAKVAWFEDKNVLLVKDDREVYAFDPRTKKVEWIYEIRPKSNLYGLCISSNSSEIVTLEPKSAQLIYLSPRFPKVQRSQPYAPVLGLSAISREASKCRFMDFNSNGDLVCSDLGLSVIYLTSLNGQTLNIFGCRGDEWGKFLEPSGVTGDKNGHLLIADSKHDRIQCFDDLGNYICPVDLSIRSRRPSDILLTRQNRQLLVMNYLDHLVRVYSLEEA